MPRRQQHWPALWIAGLIYCSSICGAAAELEHLAPSQRSALRRLQQFGIVFSRPSRLFSSSSSSNDNSGAPNLRAAAATHYGPSYSLGSSNMGSYSSGVIVGGSGSSSSSSSSGSSSSTGGIGTIGSTGGGGSYVVGGTSLGSTGGSLSSGQQTVLGPSTSISGISAGGFTGGSSSLGSTGGVTVGPPVIVGPAGVNSGGLGAGTAAAGSMSGAGVPGGSSNGGISSNGGSGSSGGGGGGSLLPGQPAVTTTVATAFDVGYCVPRQSFVVVNVTSLACNPGSNITLFEGAPVCARIDCTYQPDRGNIIAAAAFCRTVVEQPRFICPRGCDLIQQDVTNTTTNVTSTINRCSCRAGNQACPGSYVGCVCQPQPPSVQARTQYVLCSDSADQCEQRCQLSVGKLGPLCPIVPDATLPGANADPNGPVYPRWSWDIAAQGQATAAVAPGTPVGRRLQHKKQQQQQQPANRRFLTLAREGAADGLPGGSAAGVLADSGLFRWRLWWRRQTQQAAVQAQQAWARPVW